MPPEQDETRARQIEALRQYINQLSEHREDPKVEVGMRLPDVTVQHPRRPPLSWLLVTALLVAVALVGGVFVGASAWSDDRPPASGSGGVTVLFSSQTALASNPARTSLARVSSTEAKL